MFMRITIISLLAALATSAFAVGAPVRTAGTLSENSHPSGLSASQTATIHRLSRAVIQARGQNPLPDVLWSKDQLARLRQAITDTLSVNSDGEALKARSRDRNAPPDSGRAGQADATRAPVKRTLNKKLLQGIARPEAFTALTAVGSEQEAVVIRVEREITAALDDEEQGYRKLQALSERLTPKRLAEMTQKATGARRDPAFITIVRHR